MINLELMCDTCGKKFISSLSLNAHQKSHSDITRLQIFIDIATLQISKIPNSVLDSVLNNVHRPMLSKLKQEKIKTQADIRIQRIKDKIK